MCLYSANFFFYMLLSNLQHIRFMLVDEFPVFVYIMTSKRHFQISSENMLTDIIENHYHYYYLHAFKERKGKERKNSRSWCIEEKPD